MTPQRDIERVLEHWLADGVDVMPDRTYLTILDRVERQPQQRAWRVSWRDSQLNGYIKPLVAIAAVVVIVVAGIAFFGRPAGADVGASPSPSPSADAVFPSWYAPDSGAAAGAGTLSAGSHSTSRFDPSFTYTVPEGWVNSVDDIGFYGLFQDTPANAAEHAASDSFVNEMIIGPNTSPHFVCDAWEDNSGSTAAEIVAAMVANEALGTSEPIDVAIGGLTGKQVDVQLDPAWTESCPGDPPTLDLGDIRTRTILLDSAVGGVLLINMGSLHSDGHEAFLAEAMPIVESFQFDVTP